MTIFTPIWLILLLPLIIPLLLWKAPSKGVLFLRVILLILIVLAMAGLALKLPSSSGTVVVVADRSLSMPLNADANIREILNIVWKSRPIGSRLGIISYSEKSGIEKMPENYTYDGLKLDYQGDQSNLDQAMKDALSLIPDNSPGRILLLTDGAWTGENPSGEFARCASRDIPVDFRMFGVNRANDLAINDIAAPHSAPADEFFLVHVEISSPQAKTISYMVFRNGRPRLRGKLKLVPGINRFVFRDCSATPQTIRYKLELSDVGRDPCLGNNTAGFLVNIKGKRPMLLVTMSHNSNLGKILKLAGHNIHVREPHELEFSIKDLNGYSSIILENVPSNKIGDSGMQTIAELVRKAGTGLMITGGQNAFGLGGYYNSPLEGVMPVSMELRKEHRKLSMAIVLVLDRSGSMAAWASNGRTKMDLANTASAEVLNILSPMDSIGVIAVDSQPHTVVNMMPVESAMSMRNKILHIQSMGGGIYVYNGLVAAGKMLARATAGTKHVILFADAADAEQPGRYKELLAKFRAAGITVSVIGLGTRGDVDAKFLLDVAKRGGGRCFFTKNAMELPRLFTQDTFVVARNTFVGDPTKVKTTGALRSVTGRNIGKSFELGGYNLCYLRPKASLGAVTQDEYKAPAVAFWQAELGRVICFTGEADGKYSGKFAKWPDAGKLLSDMAAWTSADKQPLPQGMMLSQEINNGINKIRLHLDPERKNDPFKKRPMITTLAGIPGRPPQSVDAAMKWETPDILLAQVPLSSAATSLSTVKIPGISPQVLAPVMLPYSPEYKPAANDDTNRSSIKQLCMLSGGKERLNLADIWNELPTKQKLRSISQWLLVAALIVLLLEVLERRTGIIFKRYAVKFRKTASSTATARTSGIKPGKKRRKRSKIAPEKVIQPKPESSPETPEEKPAETDDNQHQILSALNKVKKNQGKSLD